MRRAPVTAARESKNSALCAAKTPGSLESISISLRAMPARRCTSPSSAVQNVQSPMLSAPHVQEPPWGVSGVLARRPLAESGSREDARSVGKECASTCRYRWSPIDKKTKQHEVVAARSAHQEQ